MKHANLFDTDHPVREDYVEEPTSGEKNINTVRTTAATTTQEITPSYEAII